MYQKIIKILFCHESGARGHFAALPLNLLGEKTTADYIDGGYWAKSAADEAEKYCSPNIIKIKTEIDGKIAVKPMKEWQLSDNAAYACIIAQMRLSMGLLHPRRAGF